MRKWFWIKSGCEEAPQVVPACTNVGSNWFGCRVLAGRPVTTWVAAHIEGFLPGPSWLCWLLKKSVIRENCMEHGIGANIEDMCEIKVKTNRWRASAVQITFCKGKIISVWKTRQEALKRPIIQHPTGTYVLHIDVLAWNLVVLGQHQQWNICVEEWFLWPHNLNVIVPTRSFWPKFLGAIAIADHGREWNVASSVLGGRSDQDRRKDDQGNLHQGEF